MGFVRRGQLKQHRRSGGRAAAEGNPPRHWILLREIGAYGEFFGFPLVPLLEAYSQGADLGPVGKPLTALAGIRN
jgi:hypothetical protein